MAAKTIDLEAYRVLARTATRMIVRTPRLSQAGYSLRPWRPEIGAMPRVVGLLDRERTVLVQSGLYPHAGYDDRFQLLTSETLRDPRFTGAALVLAPRLSAYPMQTADLDPLLQLPVLMRPAPGIVVVCKEPSLRP